jgi:hypothetical protein
MLATTAGANRVPFRSPRPHRRPGPHRPGDALEVLAAEILQIEEIAEKPFRGVTQKK